MLCGTWFLGFWIGSDFCIKVLVFFFIFMSIWTFSCLISVFTPATDMSHFLLQGQDPYKASVVDMTNVLFLNWLDIGALPPIHGFEPGFHEHLHSHSFHLVPFKTLLYSKSQWKYALFFFYSEMHCIKNVIHEYNDWLHVFCDELVLYFCIKILFYIFGVTKSKMSVSYSNCPDII